MPNRLFRDGYLDSEAVNDLSDFAERVFARMLIAADDAGRLDGRIAILRSKIRPLDSVRRNSDFERALAEICRAGLAYCYAVENGRFVQLTKVQKGTPAKTSKFPDWQGTYEIVTVKRSTRDGKKDFVLSSIPEGMPGMPELPFPKGSLSLPEPLPKGSGSEEPTRAGSGSDSETGSSLAPSSADADSKPEPGEIFTTAAGKEWHAPPDLLEGFAAAFPGVSVPAECAKARVWLLANPTKRKTDRGMPKFLNGWMERAQNRGTAGPYDRPRGLAPPPPQRDPSENARRLAEARAMGERKA